MLRASDIFGAPAGAIGVKRKLTEKSAKSKAALPLPPSVSLISGLLYEADEEPLAQFAKAKPALPRPLSACLISGLLTEADKEPFVQEVRRPEIATRKSGHISAGVSAALFKASHSSTGTSGLVGDSTESARLVDAALRSVLQPQTTVQEPRLGAVVAPKPDLKLGAKKESWHKIPRGQAPKVGATIAVRKSIRYKEYELKPGMRGVVTKVNPDGHAKVKWKSFGTQYLLKANYDAIASKVEEEEEDPPTDLEAVDTEPRVGPEGNAASMASKALSWLEQAASAEQTGTELGLRSQAASPPMGVPPARPGWSVIELVTEWTAVQAQVQEHLRVTQAYAAQVLPGHHQKHVEVVNKAQEEARVALLRWLAGKEDALKALHLHTSHLGYAELMLLPAEERQHGASLQTMVRAVVAQEAAGLPSTSGWLFQWLSGLGQGTLAGHTAPAPAPSPVPVPPSAPAVAAKPPMLLSKARGPPPGSGGGPFRQPPSLRPPNLAADLQAQEDAILARNLRGALFGLPEHSRGLLAKAATGGDALEHASVLKWVVGKSKVA